jgi:hypothetical protein
VTTRRISGRLSASLMMAIGSYLGHGGAGAIQVQDLSIPAN